MDINTLNEAQRKAVTLPPGSALILAGAGSGKTRVLTHRIAWLVENMGLSPWSILAVTFTNKAAAEMRSRIEALLGMPMRGMWVGTFHGLAHRLLRTHRQEAGLPEHFHILDSDDQLHALKRVIKSLQLDESKWPARQAQWYINSKKDAGLRASHYTPNNDYTEAMLHRIYSLYEQQCRQLGLVDFAELLLRVNELWLESQSVREHYRERFQAVLVDEFQDTNAIQYAWLRNVVGDSDSLWVVGDDDQSIYGWRGARVENIAQFSHDFASAQTIKLEQNYRSTEIILQAANAVIANNTGRLGKSLWTADKGGDNIQVYAAFNEVDEARFIVNRIRSFEKEGKSWNDIVILYRSNAQSRVLEEAMLRSSVPYRIYGGQRFFERAEIKNALAYLRLVSHVDDDAAFERVVNVPARGLGEKTVQLMRDVARTKGLSMWAASLQLLQQEALSGRAANAVKSFMQIISTLTRDVATTPLHDLAARCIEASGLFELYKKEKSEKGQARIDNLEELIVACREFDSVDLAWEPREELISPLDAFLAHATLEAGDRVKLQARIDNLEELIVACREFDSVDLAWEPREELISPLDAFLAHATLEAGDKQADEFAASVQMMTLHSAKGLEFPFVFLAGMEEGLFPHQMSMHDPERLQEERRLCYVGITRARQQLYMTYAESRRLHGQESRKRPSRFLREVPDQFKSEVRMKAAVSRPATARRDTLSAAVPGTDLCLGQRVRHATLGEGVVLNFEGSGAQARVQVNFDTAGSKWLMVSYAKLAAVSPSPLQT